LALATRFALLHLAFAFALLAPVSASAAGPFADWAAIVVSGDDHAAHTDAHTETFDNARRDVAAELVRKGFSAQNVRQYSVEPEHFPKAGLGKADFDPVYQGLRDLARQAKSGCLVYFTSHGAPQGVVLDGGLMPPEAMDQLVTDACGERPTVVIISACFSGVFLPILDDPDRMILTAARPDRASFGCGESDNYPYFDACVLQSFPKAHDFAALGPMVQACVARREIETGASPPSEPQLLIGAAIRPILPLMVFPPG